MAKSCADVVVVHEEIEICDLLRGFFEAHGFATEVERTLNAAVARLATPATVVVTALDRPLGKAIYKWASPELRERFLFVADRIPERFDDAERRGRVVRLGDVDGLLAALSARMRRPRLLLVEDDHEQSTAMAELLTEAGYQVDVVTGGVAAIERLGRTPYACVLSDWAMSNGSGADLLAWMVEYRSELVPTLVLMTGGDPAQVRAASDGVPVFPKGQDSPQLIELLRRASLRRVALGTPSRGIYAL